jgi:archaellum component FlaG (FlaF/FlaG flagellin family)
VQQELIVEIHRTAIWPVVVTVDGNISKTTETEFIDRDGSYIILTPDWNIKSFVVEINVLAVGRNRFTRFCNYNSRFVVAGAKEFSMSQQNNILNCFSI